MHRSKIIKNREVLATSEMREKALDILETGIERVLPDAIIQMAVNFNQVSKELHVNEDVFTLGDGRLFVVGGGKASGLMAEALESVIGVDFIRAGVVIEKAGPEEFATRKIQIRQAGHPIPDERGISAVKEMLVLKQHYGIDERDMVICVISGGGSALMPYPIEGISLTDKQEMTRHLLSSGADIYEINAVRKHISGVKGGRLAEYFAPAKVISLILSDVVGDDLGVISSGPTYPDSSTFSDAYAVIKKYALINKAPPHIISALKAGCRGEIADTPKSLTNARNYIIGDNRMALEAMARAASLKGFNPFIITSEQTGETSAVASQRAREILNGFYAKYNALLIGGETTPKLPDKPGRGGRNQHYAACTLGLMKTFPGDWLFASLGTDGSDYMPEIAGAIVDRECSRAAASLGIKYKQMLDNYDSNTLLSSACNSLVITGNTRTNVGDVMLYLVDHSIEK